MYLDTNKKKDIFKKYGQSETDTGTSEGQIAIFTERINHLTEYLKSNKKDNSTKRSLVLLVGKRRRLLEYLKKKDIERYRSIVKSLKLRK
tara:strand:+ start:282 stop:551 length:270 start_codon:yes stop_codon:yes gene_type:complete